MRDHLELEADEQRAAGLLPEEASHAAHRALGNTLKIEEDVRAAWGFQWLERLVQDVRYGLRQLRRNPGFTAVAILTLALGIGANTAVFSLLDGILIRRLPYRDPARLVWLRQFAPRVDSTLVPAATFIAWRNENHSFEDIGAYADHLCDGNFSSGGEPVRLDRCAEVTPDFFSVLGVQPTLGRSFLPEEGNPDAGGAMILSDAFWRSRFGADPRVLGKTIDLDGVAYTIVGVLPAGFEHPGALTPDAFVDLRVPSSPGWGERESDGMSVIARLRPGVNIDRARADSQRITQSLEREYPPRIARELAGSEIEVMPLHDHIVGDTRPALLVLMDAVGLVLLIACANVANLLLARGVARQKEFAVRATLGAARLRVLRQLLTEGIVLAVLGSAVGLLVALGTMGLVRSLQPAALARWGNAHLNGTALSLTVLVSFVTGVLFSLAPAFLVSRADLNDPLREGAGKATTGILRRRYGNAFVVFELALALPLLVVAGLLIRTFSNLRSVNPGFDPHNVLTIQVTLTERNYPLPSRQKEFFDQLLGRVRTLPGVEAAGGTTSLPLYYGFSRAENVKIENRPSTFTGDAPSVPISRVTPGYFEAMRIPLERGRLFNSEDREGTTPVAIVSREFARRFLGGENPVGLQLRFPASHNGPTRNFTIVGMVGDVRYFGPAAQLAPVVFTAITQFPTSALTLAVRTRTNPDRLTRAIRKEVQNLDSEQPIYHVATMEQRLAGSVGPQRFDAVLVGLFATVAAFLATVGILGIMHYSVAQRTHEIGIRTALGAQPGDVLRLVLMEGARLVFVGIVLGVCGAFALMRFVAGLLFGVSAADPLLFVTVPLLFAVVGLIASYIPARRAMTIDPMVALRYE